MKLIHASVPEEVHQSWHQIMLGDGVEYRLDVDFHVPMRRYISSSGGSTWIPKWAHKAIMEIKAAEPQIDLYDSGSAYIFSPLKMAIAALFELMAKTEDEEFLQAALSVFRLSGSSALATFVADAQVEYAVAKNLARKVRT